MDQQFRYPKIHGNPWGTWDFAAETINFWCMKISRNLVIDSEKTQLAPSGRLGQESGDLAVSSQFSLLLYLLWASMVPLRFLFVESPVSLEIASFLHSSWNRCLFPGSKPPIFSLRSSHNGSMFRAPGPQDSNLLVPFEVEFKCPLCKKILGFGIEHGTNLGFIKFNLKYYCIHSRFYKSGQFHPETSPRNIRNLPAGPTGPAFNQDMHQDRNLALAKLRFPACISLADS